MDPLPVGSLVRLRASNYPTKRFRHCNRACRIGGPERLYDEDSLLYVVAGAAGTGSISLVPHNCSDYVIRQIGGLVKLTSPEVDAHSIRGDMSWMVREPLNGVNGCVSLESVNRSSHFVRHQNSIVIVSPMEGSQLYKDDSSWIVDLVAQSQGSSPTQALFARVEQASNAARASQESSSEDTGWPAWKKALVAAGVVGVVVVGAAVVAPAASASVLSTAASAVRSAASALSKASPKELAAAGGAVSSGVAAARQGSPQPGNPQNSTTPAPTPASPHPGNSGVRMAVFKPMEQKESVCGRRGTCFLEAGSRAFLSALLRVYGHGLFSEADVKEGLESFRDELKVQAMDGQKQEGSGGHHEEVIKNLNRKYPFVRQLFVLKPNWTWENIEQVKEFIYKRGQLPAAASISIYYDDEHKKGFKKMPKIPKDLPDEYKPRNDRKICGHAMTLVGTAENGKYLVMLNSWGASAHGEQKGFWLLEADPDLLNDLRVKVCAAGFAKNDEEYKPYGRKWQEASEKEKKDWLKLRKNKFQEVTKVVQQFDDFKWEI